MESQKRWGRQIELDLAQLKDMEQKPQKIVREAYAVLLRHIARDITWENEQGDYPYSVPSVIRASTITSNLNVMLSLLCVVEDE